MFWEVLSCETAKLSCWISFWFYLFILTFFLTDALWKWRVYYTTRCSRRHFLHNQQRKGKLTHLESKRDDGNNGHDMMLSKFSTCQHFLSLPSLRHKCCNTWHLIKLLGTVPVGKSGLKGKKIDLMLFYACAHSKHFGVESSCWVLQ